MSSTSLVLTMLFALVALDCSGRDDPPPADGGATECTPFNCDGCCSPDGRCVDGLSNTACGNNADQCVACSSPFVCEPTGVGGGECGGCDAFNCDGCCDANQVCRSGTDDAACGYAGQRCTPCEGIASCDPRGVGGGICR